MSSSVIVIEAVGGRESPPAAHPAASGRTRATRLLLFLAVAAAHAGVIGAVIATPGEIGARPETEPLVAVILRPAIAVSRNPSVAPPPIYALKDAPILYDPQLPELHRSVLDVFGVGTMPPRVDDAEIDATRFAREAGLEPGDGATVVLRVEVFGSGELGRVEVDVSGGTPEIDREAIAYSRALVWIGGMVDGHPATVWVRWGVRLQR